MGTRAFHPIKAEGGPTSPPRTVAALQHGTRLPVISVLAVPLDKDAPPREGPWPQHKPLQASPLSPSPALRPGSKQGSAALTLEAPPRPVILFQTLFCTNEFTVCRNQNGVARM